jgi:GTP-binding protein LepA
MSPCSSLQAGEVGYVVAGIRDIAHARVGDTITSAENPAAEPLPGYKPAKPMVFCGLYPQEPGKFEALRSAFLKLSLNDASFSFEPYNSPALGFGFHCGFLGLLHMDIVQERLEREYNVPLIATAPSVAYQLTMPNGETITISNPDAFPDLSRGISTSEPYALLTITTPSQFVGPCMELTQSCRGQFKNMTYHVPTNSNADTPAHALTSKATLEYEIPLSEILFSYFDQLKAGTSGFASYDYEFLDFRPSKLVKLSILVNDDPIDALSSILHQSHAHTSAKKILHNLRTTIPRQLFEVRIQAAIGSKVIASERITPLRKDVIAKLYGGDVTRKNKLLDKQKAGKKRMKKVGKVHLPQEAFLSILQIKD